MGEMFRKFREANAGKGSDLIAVAVIIFIFGALLSLYAFWFSKTIGATNAENARLDSRIDSVSQKIDKAGYVDKTEAEGAVAEAVKKYAEIPAKTDVVLIKDDGTDAAKAEIEKAGGEALCLYVSSEISKKLASEDLRRAIKKALSENNASAGDTDALKQAVANALKEAGIDLSEDQISDAVDGFSENR